MKRVFLSSTGKDLGSHREAVFRALSRVAEIKIVRMEDFTADPRAPRRFCEEKVRDCDLFIGILGHCYGFRPPDDERSITEIEFDTAVDAKLPCLMFVAPQDFPTPAQALLAETRDDHERQQQFRARVLLAHTDELKFKTEAELASGVVLALVNRRDLLDTVAPAPFTVPPPVPDFTGRDDELATLTDALADNGRATVSAIDGMGGMGKSQLAFELAHRLTDRFPDGRIFLDMQGTGATPLSAEDVMARIIEASSPGIRPPDEPERLKAAYQATLAGKRALLLLDNATDRRQVTPLLPPVPVALLVTSRQRILLQGARRLELRSLTPEAALSFLRGMVPPERASDEALAEIARRCGHLPLALRAAGSFLQVHSSWTLQEYLDELLGERTRLEALKVAEAEIDVKTVLGLSLARLNEEDTDLAAAWTLLSVFPTGFDREAAAAVWQQDLAATRERLDALVGRSLLTAEGHARFRLHDLLRDIARERAEAQGLQAALLRHARHYKGVLGRSDALYLNGKVLDGLALFDAERANIEGAQAWVAQHLREVPDAARLCFELSDAGAFVLELRLAPRVRIRWREAALEGCRSTGDRRGEGNTLGSLGNAWADLGETARAIEHHERHLALARAIGDRSGESVALGNLGSTRLEAGETAKAIKIFEQHRALARETGNRHGEASALGNLGIASSRLGQPRAAIAFYDQQLAIVREIGDRHGEGRALGNLGNAWALLGDILKALECYDLRLVIAREIGDRRGESVALWNAAQLTDNSQGDGTGAVRMAVTALTIMRDLEDPRVPEIEAWLRERGIEP